MSQPDNHKGHSLFAFGRFLPLALLVMLALGFFLFGGDRWIQVDTLREQHQAIGSWVGQNPFSSMLLYLAAYALVVSAGLPLGALLMPLAGYLFGTLLGTLFAVLAATAGSCVLYGALRLANTHRVGDRIFKSAEHFRSGFQRNPFGHLVLVRLVPVFPFFAVTLAAVVVRIPFLPYFGATLLGVIPISLAWAMLGADLGHMLDVGARPGAKDLLKPEILIPLLLMSGIIACSAIMRRMCGLPRVSGDRS